MTKTVLDEVIAWNRRKAKQAEDPKDKARYEQNISDLKLFKEQQNA